MQKGIKKLWKFNLLPEIKIVIFYITLILLWTTHK